MQDLSRYDLSKADDNRQFERTSLTCYHCQEKTGSLTLCELWGVSACKACYQNLHLPHHKSCKRSIDRSGNAKKKSRHLRTFRLQLTHFTGRPFPLRCKLGQTLEMEDHPLGTYIYSPSCMVLVLEHRDEINLAILEGLRSVNVA